MRIWMHPYLPRRNLRIVIHRWGSLSCAWRPTDSELHRWPVDPTSGNVKLLLPPRRSRGNSHYGLATVLCVHRGAKEDRNTLKHLELNALCGCTGNENLVSSPSRAIIS